MPERREAGERAGVRLRQLVRHRLTRLLSRQEQREYSLHELQPMSQFGTERAQALAVVALPVQVQFQYEHRVVVGAERRLSDRQFRQALETNCADIWRNVRCARQLRWQYRGRRSVWHMQGKR